MTAVEAIEAFLTKNSEDRRTSDSETYRLLLEAFGDQLLPGLLSLLQSPRPEIRAAAITLLSTRRPHERRVADAIGLLIRDPDGLVMLTATDRLAEFPLEMVRPFLDDAYQMFHDHIDAEDVVPSIAAMRLCLRVDFEAFKEALLPRLLSMIELYDGLEGYLLSMTLHDLGLDGD